MREVAWINPHLEMEEINTIEIKWLKVTQDKNNKNNLKFANVLYLIKHSLLNAQWSKQ